MESLAEETEYWQDTQVVLGVIGGNGKLTRVYANWGLETVFAEGCKTVEGAWE
jgi:hypothetical protein